MPLSLAAEGGRAPSRAIPFFILPEQDGFGSFASQKEVEKITNSFWDEELRDGAPGQPERCAQ
jgi:hypothetical protein